MTQTIQQPEKTAVYVPLEHGMTDEVIAFSEEIERIGMTCFVVSADPSEEERERFKGRKFIEGDIIAVIHQFNFPFSALAKWSTNSESIITKTKSVVFLSSLEDKYQVVTSISSIPMRVKFSSLFESRGIYGIDMVCADSEFWQKVLSVHVRWMSEGFVDQNSNYMELLVNSCVSIYDVGVSIAEANNA